MKSRITQFSGRRGSNSVILGHLRQFASFVLVVLAPLPTLYAANNYIRAGATNGSNDGSSWANAWTNFASATWIRGDTNFVAGGTYKENVTISAQESGSIRITLKKANANDNGSDAGWNSTFEQSVAIVQGDLAIQNSYVTIDGVRGTGTNGYGIKIYQPIEASGNAIINFANTKSFLSMTHIELQGPGMGYPVGVSGFKQNNTGVLTKGNTFTNLYFHELSQNGFVFVNIAGTSYSDYGLLFDNVVLFNCGYNVAGQHGQGIQGGSGAAGSTNSYWVVRNSQFGNIIGTAAIAFLGYSQNDHIDIYNNIFHNANLSFNTNWIGYVTLNDAFSPGVIYVSSTGASASYIRIYNNTFYNISRNTIYFGSPSLANNELANNLFLSGYFNIVNQGVTGRYDDYYGCLPIITAGMYGVPFGEVGQQGEASNPCFDVAGGDFRLLGTASAVGNGTNLASVFTTDIVGNPRGNNWDIGAYQHVAGLTPASNLRVVGGPPP